MEDLHLRGLADDCAVVIWGEFGRTPVISKQVGRDHWPQVNCALLAGGGMRHGQVIGATDRIAGEAVNRPVTFGEVYATLFQHLGIDAGRTTILDLNGRPAVSRGKSGSATARVDLAASGDFYVRNSSVATMPPRARDIAVTVTLVAHRS